MLERKRKRMLGYMNDVLVTCIIETDMRFFFFFNYHVLCLYICIYLHFVVCPLKCA